MSEDWRVFLYPLGFLSGILFGARFILQWLQSEKAGKSVVSKLFWQFSLAGNLLLAIHGFIQLQFHVCIIQACNVVISWRNLALMQKENQAKSIRHVIWQLLLVILLTTIGFALQDLFLSQAENNWFRIPTISWYSSQMISLSIVWHLIGFLGYALFSSRFWIQWWLAEQAQTSYLPLSFWWLSLIGAITSGIYFLYIGDLVNLIGPLIGLIPYTRNLMLLYKSSRYAKI